MSSCTIIDTYITISGKAGELAVTVCQDAKGQGSGSVDAAVKMIKKQKVQDGNMIPYVLVTPENVSKCSSNAYD